MPARHFTGESAQQLLAMLPETLSGRSLVLCYATVSVEDLTGLCEGVSRRWPQALVVGISSDGVIMDGKLSHGPVAVSVLSLPDGVEDVQAHDALDAAAQQRCGNWLAGQKDRVVVAWCAGEPAELDRFWKGVRADVPVAGGVVGHCQDGRGALWAQGRLIESGCVLLSLPQAQTTIRRLDGWQAVTRAHRITRSEGDRVIKIDHQPAEAFYRRYLDVSGLSRQQLFEIGLAFPLMVEMAPDQWVVRGVLHFNEDGSLLCVGEVPEGAAVRLAVGSAGRLMAEADALSCPQPGSALVFFCLGRRMLLGPWLKSALEPFSTCATSGFFSFGELFTPAGQSGRLLNHTAVVVGIIKEPSGADGHWVPAKVARRLPDTADLLVSLLVGTHGEHERIERLLTLASHLIVQFQKIDGRWRLQQVMGKTALLGHEPQTLLNGRVDLFDQLEPAGRQRLTGFLASDESARLLHTRICRADGNWLPVALLTLHTDDELLWLVEDLSAQQALTRIYEMFERGPVVQFEWSGAEGWPIRYVSPNVTDVLGLPYESLVTGEAAFADFIHRDDLQRVIDEVVDYLSNHITDFQQEYRIVTPGGAVRWVRDYTHVIYGDDGGAETIYGFVLDITREKEALVQLEKEKQQAAWKAMHDPLTGLYNRSYLRDMFPVLLRQTRRQGWMLDLMFIDLDNFKEVNDVHGHNVGDQILMQFARRLRELLRRSDVIARFGGDEFVVVAQIEEQDRMRAADKARVLAEKILDALKEPFLVDGEAFRLGASVGIVLVDEQMEEDFDTLIRYADTSMYLAKRSGRNGYRFFDEQQQKQEEARALKLTALRQAIEKRELWLAYQPQVHWDGSRFELCGAEVLMRWNSDQFGAVSPGEFIPLAEDTGYILTLGDWMMEAALGQLSRWRQAGLLSGDFVLSLNISAVQFYQAEFVEKLCQLCRRYQIPPQAVRLELTERIIYKGSDEALARMKRLREYGFSTSLDDFGTGYSSLAYLKQLDLDELKIDQTFVRNFLTDESNAVLTRTIIDLAHNFHLSPIAEGTEDEHEVCALVQMGCNTFQGYFFGRPMSAADFERWLQDNPLDRLSLKGC